MQTNIAGQQTTQWAMKCCSAQGNLRFRNCPNKLRRRFVGPFRIIRKINRAAFELRLPDSWSIHPVFHTSLLKPWRESEWSCPTDAPEPDVELAAEPVYTVERILRWRRVQHGRQRYREFLVTWSDYPLEEAQWIPESNFTYPRKLKAQLKSDKPVEDTSRPS